MLWVYLLFLLCYVLFLVTPMLRYFSQNVTKTLFLVYEVSYIIMFLNSLVNPLFYSLKMRPIRRAMISLIPEKIRSRLHLTIPQL